MQMSHFWFFSHDAFRTVSNTAWVRTMNCRFDALGLILNLATLFLFSLKFATEFFFLKKLNSGWRDLHFHGNMSVTRNFEKRLNPIWVANSRRCTGPIWIATVNAYKTRNRNIRFDYPPPPKSLLKSSNPKKVSAKINLPKTIPK